MRYTKSWNDYELLDTSNGERLERWGEAVVIRPDPQVIWKSGRDQKLWDRADAHYHRSSKGGGQWEYLKDPVGVQNIKWKDLIFKTQPTGFKHMGLFPEQAVNWEMFIDLIENAKRPIKVLNLFAYTGGATLACAKAGASVCHVDASKGMVGWAKENAQLSGLKDKPIRWIVDDCEKFALREIRRGNKYDAIILDPPSYGRGPSGEIWKLEDKIYDLLVVLEKLLSENPLFFALNSYTTGLSSQTMGHLLSLTVSNKFKEVRSDEIGLKEQKTNLLLPCGSTAYAI